MAQEKDPVIVNRAQDLLAKDEIVLSLTVRLARTVEIAAIAKSSGFDVVRIDLEHNTFSLDTTSQICMATLAHGLAPFVRVPSLSGELITRVLDGGALGIVVPHITSAEDARHAVSCVKYPPLGQRSAAASLSYFNFRGYPAETTNRVVNSATTVIALIENKQGLDNVEEIAAVEGIDLISIGTNDLCADLGIPGQLYHEQVEKAYLRMIAACKKNGKHSGVGGFAGKPDLIQKYVRAGGRYISLENDLSLMMKAATDRVQSTKDLLKR